MRRNERRRPMHYESVSLYDGTILAAYPVRKPLPKVIKRDHLKIDKDGVCKEGPRSGQELSRWDNDSRFRFQDIIATRLNTRRAIRELVLPELAAIREEITALRSQLDHLSRLLEQK